MPYKIYAGMSENEISSLRLAAGLLWIMVRFGGESTRYIKNIVVVQNLIKKQLEWQLQLGMFQPCISKFRIMVIYLADGIEKY